MYLNFVACSKTLAQATCTFPTPLLLTQPHEIAILTLDLTQKFFNGPPAGAFLRVWNKEKNLGKYKFPQLVFPGLASVAKTLNIIMISAGVKDHIKWNYREDSNRIAVSIKAGFAVDLSPTLETFLKVDSGSLNNKDGIDDKSGSIYPDIMQNFRLVFLECDQVESRHYYKNTMLPALCSIPIHPIQPERDMISFDFHESIYYKLKTNYVEQLTVTFTDELRRPLNIDKGGYCYVLAHLRPVE